MEMWGILFYKQALSRHSFRFMIYHYSCMINNVDVKTLNEEHGIPFLRNTFVTTSIFRRRVCKKCGNFNTRAASNPIQN